MRGRRLVTGFGLGVLGILLLGGCSTYLETNRRLSTGYYSDLQLEASREQQLAQDDQVQLQRDLTTLQQQQQSTASQEAELQKQLAEVEADLNDASRELEKAHAENRVGRQEYERLKAEIDTLQLQQQTQSIAPGDAAEKRRQLVELQKKKEALQKSIKELLSPS